ncbi:hypothetical protein ACI2KG_08850 [Pseudomonas sp. NPDC089407]|uniref:hypothetical protein n=1 Tax=Pseudomonas sp. NPDC089407 TaxID=3364464 RepID=UPI00384E7960
MSQGSTGSEAVNSKFYAGIVVGFTAIGGLLALLHNYSDFKIVDSTSYISVRELGEKYYTKEFVAEHYIGKNDVATNYITKEEAQHQASELFSADKVKLEYVPKQKYEELEQVASTLSIKLNEIPNPFSGRNKMLSSSGQWTDPQLGITISIRKALYSESGHYVQILLALPDSPLHEEHLYSEDLRLCKWTFVQNNREFELKAESLRPIVFSVKEITKAS